MRSLGKEGLYGKRWTKIITKESEKSHPAKFSRGMIYWLIEKGLEENWWKEGEILIDPMCGIGCGGIAATDLGMKWVGIELEPKFVEMAYGNFDLHYPRWFKEGRDFPEVYVGDARYLSSTLKANGVISSPPFSPKGKQVLYSVSGRDINDSTFDTKNHFMESPGNIANMSVISSPPFSPSGSQPRIGQGTRKDLKLQGKSPENKEQGSEGNIALYKTNPLIRQDINPNSYWGAISLVINNLYEILPHNGIVAWVVKAFVRKGKIVDLPSMSLDLFEDLGFKGEMWIDAGLTRESGKVYKSFFRNVWESKEGYPSIDEEVILIMRKP